MSVDTTIRSVRAQVVPIEDALALVNEVDRLNERYSHTIDGMLTKQLDELEAKHGGLLAAAKGFRRANLAKTGGTTSTRRALFKAIAACGDDDDS